MEADVTSTPSAIAEMVRMVKDELQSEVMTRQELVAKLGTDDLLYKALGRLVKSGEVCRPKRGSYELAVSSEPPNLRGKDSEETAEGGSDHDD